ncbi:MAG: hypothetical protein AAGA81_21755, partial [Acidobacteriota bacterium]
EVMELAKEVSKELTEVEEQLTQTKSKSNQDPLNFPPMIDNQFVELYAYVVASQHKPPAGAYERLDDLAPELDGLLTKLGEIQSGKVTELNEKVAGLALPAIGTAPTDDD